MNAALDKLFEQHGKCDKELLRDLAQSCGVPISSVGVLRNALHGLLQPLSVVLDKHALFFDRFIKTYTNVEKQFGGGGGGGGGGEKTVEAEAEALTTTATKKNVVVFRMSVQGNRGSAFAERLIEKHAASTRAYFHQEKVETPTVQNKSTSKTVLSFSLDISLRTLCTMLLGKSWTSKLRSAEDIPCGIGVAMSQGGPVTQHFFETAILGPIEAQYSPSVGTIAGASKSPRSPGAMMYRAGGCGGIRSPLVSPASPGMRHYRLLHLQQQQQKFPRERLREVMDAGDFHVREHTLSPRVSVRMNNVRGNLAFLREDTLQYVAGCGESESDCESIESRSSVQRDDEDTRPTFLASTEQLVAVMEDADAGAVAVLEEGGSSSDEFQMDLAQRMPGAVCLEECVGCPKEDILFWMVLFREYLNRYMPLEFCNLYEPFKDWRAQFAFVVGHMTRRGDAQTICNGPIFGSFYLKNKDLLAKADDMGELFQNLLHQCNNIDELKKHSSGISDDLIESAQEQALQTRKRVQNLYANHARKNWRAVSMKKMRVEDLCGALKASSRVIEYETLVGFMRGRNVLEYTCVQIDTTEASILELKASIDILIQVQPELMREDSGSYLFVDDILVIHEGMLLVLRDISYSHAFRNSRICTKTVPLYPVYMYMYFCTRDATRSIAHSDDIAVRSVVRAIRNWITASHTLSSWILDVEDPLFVMYRDLHLLLARWNTKERMVDAIEEGIAAYDKKEPSLFTVLLSFFYLRKKHSILKQGLVKILEIVDESTPRSEIFADKFPHLKRLLELQRDTILENKNNHTERVSLDLVHFISTVPLHEGPATDVDLLWRNICDPYTSKDGARCYGCTKQIGCDRNCMPCVDIFNLCLSSIVTNAEARVILKAILPPSMPTIPMKLYGRKFHHSLYERLSMYVEGFSADFDVAYTGRYRFVCNTLSDFEQPVSSMCMFLRVMEWTSLHSKRERKHLSDIQGPCEVDPVELLAHPKALPIAMDRNGMVVYGDMAMFLIIETSDTGESVSQSVNSSSRTSMRKKIYGGLVSPNSAVASVATMIPCFSDFHNNHMGALEVFYTRTDRCVDLLLQYEHTLSNFIDQQCQLRQEYAEQVALHPQILSTNSYVDACGHRLPFAKDPQEMPYAVLRDGDPDLSFSRAMNRAYQIEVEKRLRKLMSGVKRPLHGLDDSVQRRYLERVKRRKIEDSDKHRELQKVFTSFAESNRQSTSQPNSAGAITS